MSKDYSKAMSEQTDKKLAEILNANNGDYDVEAIKAAELEFNRRNLSLADFPIDFQSNNDVSSDLKKFEWYHKVLTVAMPAIITPIVVSIGDSLGSPVLFRTLPMAIIILLQYSIYKRLKTNGDSLIAADFLKWVTYSYYIYIGLAIFLALAVSLIS